MSTDGANRLKTEQSPYLLKHATNPVDWFPWGDEAFSRARELDRPVFLSIGYTTCHWCNVMEEESFSDAEVGALLNASFICVKVDREERPDIDGIYMAACNMLTGAGGWPLTIFMTPEGLPFHAATYIPKLARFGRQGMMELIPRVAALWRDNRQELLGAARKITRSLAESVQPTSGDELGPDELASAFEGLRGMYDAVNGGFGGRMKFPMPHNIMFLLRYHRRTAEAHALEMSERTLDGVLKGGVRDHLGGGFHRYATDPEWRVPHFEKMLYDQALMTLALMDAYLVTGKSSYALAARDTIEFVMRDLTDPDGGFYSALGADSEGEEGGYYLWGMDQARAALSADELDIAMKVYGIEERGNFRDSITGEPAGVNILYLKSAHERMDEIRGKLYQARRLRPRPELDDKVLVDTCGLMIAALSVAGRVLNEPEYVAAAGRAVDFIMDKMRDDEGHLLHTWRRGGQAKVRATADDYAFLIWGVTELYLSTFDLPRLEAAVQLQREMIRNFWDDEGGGFWFTPFYGEQGIVKKKEIYDGAVPSSNSVSTWNLLRLGRMVGDAQWEQMAGSTMRAFAGDIRENPMAYTMMMNALDFALGPTNEVVIAGRPGADDTNQMLRAMRSVYMPNAIVMYLPVSEDEPRPGVLRWARYMDGMGLKNDRAAAYVCTGYACRQPVDDPNEALKIIGEK